MQVFHNQFHVIQSTIDTLDRLRSAVVDLDRMTAASEEMLTESARLLEWSRGNQPAAGKRNRQGTRLAPTTHSRESIMNERQNESDATQEEAKSEAAETRREEGEAFRGVLGSVCANESSNDANPELCGSEEPLYNDKGEYIGPEVRPVPSSAPTK